MNYADLQARLLAAIGRAPAAICYEMVTADINSTLRIREMETTATKVEAASVTLPTDFLEMISVYRDTDPRVPLRPTTTTGINTVYSTSGVPTTYAIVAGALLLNPSPDGSENLELRYYARVADLADDADTNDILANYPAIYIYGVLAHHAALIRDMDAAVAYKAAYEEQKRLARAADANARHSGAPLVPTVRATP